jgi:cation diffusion facilitator CzcD-associated flavoprotein CzcO
LTLPLRILIIGAGFAGLGAAMALKRAGFTHITIFDRGAQVGGVWRDNTYPGCACDVPSHLYSFSFDTSFDWHHAYAKQPQIWAYLQHLAQQHGLHEHLRLNTEVRSAAWSQEGQVWNLHLANGETVQGDVLIQGVGALVKPKKIDIEGLADFAGPVFHSTRWQHDVPLQGQRVALIGTGASAIQLGPYLAKVVQQLHIFQRNAPWVMPKGDQTYSPLKRWLYQRVPGLLRLNRWRIYWLGELFTLGFLGHRWAQKIMRRAGLRHIQRHIAKPELQAKVTPNYAPGCKRVLVSDEWYPTLNQPHVNLVTSPIERITPEGIVTQDGQLHGVDAIILATGFSVSGALARTQGRGGQWLGEVWKHSAATHLGLSTHGFPNMFTLLGPGTGLGSNSVIFMLEAQLKHMVQAVQYLALSGGTLEIKPEVQTQSYAQLQQRMKRTVWASGCSSWYQATPGRIDTLWPDFSLNFWRQTRHFDASVYDVSPSVKKSPS